MKKSFFEDAYKCWLPIKALFKGKTSVSFLIYSTSESVVCTSEYVSEMEAFWRIGLFTGAKKITFLKDIFSQAKYTNMFIVHLNIIEKTYLKRVRFASSTEDHRRC